MDSKIDLHKAAKEFSKLGASKGGRARANVLTKEEKSEIGRNAVRARWKKEGKLKDTNNNASDKKEEIKDVDIPTTPYSLFKGTLNIGGFEIECHVLSDFRRVFTQREVVRILSNGRESGNLIRYLDNNPLIDKDLILGQTFPFKIPNTREARGFESTVLIDICDKYLELGKRKLVKASQKKLVAQAEMVIRACAKVGIIALVDEATGYQEYRAKNALQLKLQAFIADEMQTWARMFPSDFWYELARLESIRYSPRSRPLRWGKYIMMFVYDAIDSDIGKELRKKNPKPRFLKNHHQWLKEFGREKVNNQIQQVIAIMKLCKDMDDFKKKFKKVFDKGPRQLELFEDF